MVLSSPQTHLEEFPCDERQAQGSLCRLNWQLHFGEAPKWSDKIKFILVDVEPSPRDAKKAALVLEGDAGLVAEQLTKAVRPLRISSWQQELKIKVPNFLALLSCPSEIVSLPETVWEFCWKA